MMQTVTRASLAFVGHYDPSPDSIASAALGSMYASITGLSMGLGMTLAVGAYCSRNFGRECAEENGVVVRHCLAAQGLCFAFALFMAMVSEPLLDTLGQPTALLEPVRRFSVISAFAWPGTWAFTCFNTVLSSQGLQLPGVFGQSLSSGATFMLSWLFLSHGSGFLGIAVANIVAAWMGAASIALYVIVSRRQGTVWRVPMHISAVGQLTFCEYLATALPTAFSMWVEWWAVEILAIFAGRLPGRDVALAAHGILFNTLAVVYMAFLAVSRACMLRVGQQVGAGDIPGIQRAVAVCVIVAVSLACVVASLLHIYGDMVLRLFTHDEEILVPARDALPGVWLSVPPYAVMICLAGALRAAALQTWGAKSLFVSFYLLGLPIGYLTGIVEHGGLLGIWIGNVTALSCAAAASSAKVVAIDWNEIVRQAHALEERTPCRIAAGDDSKSDCSDDLCGVLSTAASRRISRLGTLGQHPALSSCLLDDTDCGTPCNGYPSGA